jgi:hypothetical protein
VLFFSHLNLCNWLNSLTSRALRSTGLRQTFNYFLAHGFLLLSNEVVVIEYGKAY